MHRVIGVVAHVDAGKTTLSEQMLVAGGALRQAGRVDAGNTLLDADPVERQRGITIFSDQGAFSWGNVNYSLLDTPGHVDFAPAMERALSALDCAILVVSAVEGVQAHTRMIWKLLMQRGLPVFVFINKTDRAGADYAGVLAALQSKLCPAIVDFSQGMTETAMAALAEADEDLLEPYINGAPPEFWLAAARRLISGGKLFPCLGGAALQGLGVTELLDALNLYLEETETRDAPFGALVYRVSHDDAGNRLTHLKITGGTLVAKAQLGPQKVDELRLRQGARWKTVAQVEAGQLCLALGLQLPVGTALGAALAPPPCQMAPVLTAGVAHDKAIAPQKVLAALRLLEQEEPHLAVSWQPGVEQIQVQVMGKIQLEVLAQVAQARFGLTLGFGQCRVLYRETIGCPVVGYGHFEPLRHYAEVHLSLEPTPPGSGISFFSACSTDALAANYQSLIRTHVLEKQHLGVLTGSPLTDVRITLLAGRAHEEHTEGGDFREATYRAIRQGLEQAQSIVLEPYYAFALQLPPGQLGRALGDLQQMGGKCQPPKPQPGDEMLLLGRAPVAGLADYATTLATYTGGRGLLTLEPGGYEPCGDQQGAIAAVGYDKVRDVENPSESIFCAKGAKYTVKWQDVPRHIHIK